MDQCGAVAEEGKHLGYLERSTLTLSETGNGP